MPTNPLALAQQFRAELQRLDALALQQLIAAYAPIRKDLDSAIDALLMDIELMQGPTAIRVKRTDRYKRLIETIGERLNEYSLFLLVAMRGATGQGVVTGATHGAQMLAELGRQPFSVNPQAVQQLAAFLDPSSALYKKIQLLAPYTAQRVADAILDGVSMGQGPATIAAAINRSFGLGLTDSLRMTRTVQVYSYRYANHATFMANGVDTWTWFSRLDPGRTCMSCVRMHGTVHPSTTTLNDHHNGLCIPIPNVGASLVQQQGEEWFTSQPEHIQQQMMGKGAFEAWKNKQFEFGQLSKDHEDPVYGLMRTVAPLKELIQ